MCLVGVLFVIGWWFVVELVLCVGFVVVCVVFWVG